MKKLRYIVLMLSLLLATSASVQAQEASATEAGEVNVNELVFGHIGDAYEWHIATIGGKTLSIPLPVIVHSSTGWHVFSSSVWKKGNMKAFTSPGEVLTTERSWSATLPARK